MLRAFILSLSVLSLSGELLAAAETNEQPLRAPEISEEQVKEVFGDALSKANRAENLLFLAIAYDHNTKGSPTNKTYAGIPFIVDKGPGYWVKLFKMKDMSLDVLVNNAILLNHLPSKNDDTANRKQAAFKLLKHAANQGYWPAKVYVAETILEQNNKIQSKADLELAFKYLTECSSIDFAPCSLKLGMLYLADKSKPGAWIPFFESSVELVREDLRYNKSHETMSDLHFALAVLSDEKSFPEERREYYKNILVSNEEVFQKHAEQP